MRLGLLGRIGVMRDGGDGLTGQGLRFALVGSLATVLQLGLYAFLCGSAGAQLANIAAWLVATMVATSAHHHFTFRVTGAGSESDHLVGLLTSLAGLGIGSLVLAVLDQPIGLSGTVALVAVNTAVGVLRFLALRWWLTLRSPQLLKEALKGVAPVAISLGRESATPPAGPAFASAGR